MKRPRPVAETSRILLQARFSRTEILLLLLLAGSFEILLSRILPRWRLHPDLALILVLYVSMYSRPAKGAFRGTCFGLLSDLLSGTLLGLNGLSKTVIGFLAGFLRLGAMAKGALGRLLLLGAAVSLDTALIIAILDLLGQPLQEGSVWILAGRSVLTSVAGVFVFRSYDRIKFPPKDFSGKSVEEEDPF